MTIKQKEIKERFCDICNSRIINLHKDYSCKICKKQDLCRECRIQLLQNHKTENITYTYSTIYHGFICKNCLLNIEMDGL